MGENGRPSAGEERSEAPSAPTSPGGDPRNVHSPGRRIGTIRVHGLVAKGGGDREVIYS